jgi:hypothetical protein
MVVEWVGDVDSSVGEALVGQRVEVAGMGEGTVGLARLYRRSIFNCPVKFIRASSSGEAIQQGAPRDQHP